MIVKVCGVRTAAIAEVAVEAGADWIGVVLEPRSVRAASRAELAAVRRAVRGRAAVVGVVVAGGHDDLDALATDLRLDALQVHGLLDTAPLAGVGVPVVPAFNPRRPLDLAGLPLSPELPLLLDAPPATGGLPGGTGRTVDLDEAAALAVHRPVVLAGGLGPGRVGDAVSRVHPWGVDASSGLESAPGVKDPDLVRTYVAEARAALAAAPGR